MRSAFLSLQLGDGEDEVLNGGEIISGRYLAAPQVQWVELDQIQLLLQS